MTKISYTALRYNLKEVMDAVVANRMTYEITQPDQEPVIMVSKSDFDAINETLYLLSTPENRAQLYESVAQAKQGQLTDIESL